ncbi:MAG: ion channel [bacterium]
MTSTAPAFPFLFKRKFTVLFIVLLIPYLLHPLIATEFEGIGLLDFSFTIILFMGVFAVSERKHIAIGAMIGVIIVQALTWTTHVVSSHALIISGIILNCLYLAYTTWVLLQHVLKAKSVTGETIFASLCVYVLIAYIFAFFYSFLEDVNPNSFRIDEKLFAVIPHGKHIFSKLYYFMYFSFTSLTTLGFGDILPASPWARVGSSIEAIVGQLYLVVLVSRLVGLHITQSVTLKPK